jgi:hypothetical protein
MYRNKKEVLETLSYFDLFDFPPTKEEVFQFLGKKISEKQFEEVMSNISNKDGFYFLNGRGILVQKRKRRDEESKEKIKKAVHIIKKVSFVPTIKFIGVSGSLSMRNSDRKDDIDIFIVAKSGSVWLTRLLVVLLLSFLGVYRKQGSKQVKDKICLNLMIDETAGFSISQRNLYLAHEIVQLLPIFERDNSYGVFIEKNRWVGKFLPNFKERVSKYPIPVRVKTSKSEILLNKVLKLLYLEELARFAQYLYMRPKITTEQIGKDVLAFHPKNYKNFVLKRAQNYTRGH